MNDLLKEAIADAKAVREVALANAKMALEEAFTPRLQSMIASKLSEEAEDDMGEDDEDYSSDEPVAEGDDEMDAELDAPIDEMEGEDDEDCSSDEPVAEGDDEMDAEDAPEEAPRKRRELPVEEAEDEDMPDEDLMEIIRQLEEELDSSEIGAGDNRRPSAVSSDADTEDPGRNDLFEEDEESKDAPVETPEETDDEFDIKEIIRALREEGEEDVETEKSEEDVPPSKSEEDLQEAYAVIKFLRTKLNEINLLNSKLLFSNKLFKSYSLTESQKITVIENFDRAGTLREVKLTYATLAESLRTKSPKVSPKKKSSLRESFASKPSASTRPSKKIITENDVMADRLRELAGIITR